MHNGKWIIKEEENQCKKNRNQEIVSSSELRVTSKTSELRTPDSELNSGGCGIRIVGGRPCGRFLAVSGKQ